MKISKKKTLMEDSKSLVHLESTQSGLWERDRGTFLHLFRLDVFSYPMQALFQ